MPKKRKSGGRSKGKKGREHRIQCSYCGKLVPRDKIKKVTLYVTLVDFQMGKELRKAGAIIPRRKITKNACVSCAIHRGIVGIRAKDERKNTRKRLTWS